MVPGLREVGEEVDRDEEQQQHPDGPLLHLRDRVVQDGGQAQAARAVQTAQTVNTFKIFKRSNFQTLVQTPVSKLFKLCNFETLKTNEWK